MNLSGRHHGGLSSQRTLAFRDYVDMFWRHKWWAFPPMMIGILLTILYSYSLPPLYHSSTLVLVEPQKVPTTYVKAPITISVRDRIGWIRQQILSRTNLERIIREFNLYRSNEPLASAEEGLVARLKTRVKQMLTTVGFYEPRISPVLEQGGIPQEYVERMRRNIEVDIVGRGMANAFVIGYTEREPYTVMRVTNKLASLFIEQNLQVRERMVEGASNFLEIQLREAKLDLERQEGALKAFKEQHMGALPRQIDTNVRKLDRLQLEMQSIQEDLRKTEEKRDLYKRQFESMKTMLMFETDVSIAPEIDLETPSNRLESLKEQLARLQAQFTDNYPDIILLKKQIQELKAHEGSSIVEPSQPLQTQTDDGAVQDRREDPTTASTEPQQSVSQQLLRAELETTLGTIDTDRDLLRQRQKEIRDQILEYERRIEDAYANEQNFFVLSRDYDISLRNYQELLRKRLSAKLSENLEKQQQGEQFRIIDPAHLPEVPVGAQRQVVLLMGSLVSIGSGMGLALLIGYLTPRFRSPDDFRGLFEQPVLATLPRSEISRKDDLLVAVEEPDSMATEQYRILYTQIRDASKEKSQKVFAISSAIENEGKSLTSFNLAIVMARDFGQKTLLLEGDLKRPSFPRYLRTEFEEGLVDILLDQTGSQSPLGPFTDTLIPFAVENLAVLPAAKSVSTSSVLLSSQRMRELLCTLRQQYDYILIDAPPVLPLSDMKIFTEVVDGVLMVVRAESTPQGAVIKALEDLKTEKLTGFILNDVWRVMPSYYRYSYYSYKKQ